MGVVLGKQEIEEEMSTQNTLQLISTDQINNELSNEFCKRTYLKCKKCQKPRTGYSWCQGCETKIFEQQFESWTSGNEKLDEMIRSSQKLARTHTDYLEWIPFGDFEDDNLQYLGDGGYSKVIMTNWTKGPKWSWDEENQQRIRSGPRKVVLKILNDSQNISNDYLKEISNHFKSNSNGHILFCYGLSQDPKTNNYIIVMDYGRNFQDLVISKTHTISWQKKIELLYDLAIGIFKLHNQKILHNNLHPGNIFLDNKYSGLVCISDIGQYFPPNHHHHDDDDDNINDKKIYGVLPYVAPEILLGRQRKKYTNSSDVYSFGMIMWCVATGQQPFSNRSHDLDLAFDICKNHLRPEFTLHNDNIPPCYVSLMKRCLDESPNRRPKLSVIINILEDWLDQLVKKKYNVINNDNSNDGGGGGHNKIQMEFELAERCQKSHQKKINTNHTIHLNAIYTSRLLDYNIEI